MRAHAVYRVSHYGRKVIMSQTFIRARHTYQIFRTHNMSTVTHILGLCAHVPLRCLPNQTCGSEMNLYILCKDRGKGRRSLSYRCFTTKNFYIRK